MESLIPAPTRIIKKSEELFMNFNEFLYFFAIKSFPNLFHLLRVRLNKALQLAKWFSTGKTKASREMQSFSTKFLMNRLFASKNLWKGTVVMSNSHFIKKNKTNKFS